jgi:hypothetical protein
MATAVTKEVNAQNRSYHISVGFFIFAVIFALHLVGYTPLQPESFFYSATGSEAQHVFNNIPGTEYFKRASYLIMLISLLYGAKDAKLGNIIKIAFYNFDILLIYVFSTFSLLWSINPALSLDKLINDLIMLAPIIYFVYMAARPDVFIFVLYVTSAALVIISLVAVMIWPDLAIHQVSVGVMLDGGVRGAWRGLFAHKNVAAGIAAFALNISLIYWIFKQRSLIHLLVFGLSIVFIYGAESKAVYASSFLVIPAALFLSSPRRSTQLVSAVHGVFLCLTAIFPYLAVHWLYPSYGIDVTSRVLIWDAGFKLVDMFPPATVEGLGYGAVFGSGLSFGGISSSDLPQIVGHSHSAIMEGYTQLGIIGCLLYLFFCWRTLRLIAQRAASGLDNRVTTIALYSVAFVCILRGWTEPDFLSGRANWCVFLAMGVLLRLQSLPAGKAVMEPREGVSPVRRTMHIV